MHMLNFRLGNCLQWFRPLLYNLKEEKIEKRHNGGANVQESFKFFPFPVLHIMLEDVDDGFLGNVF